MKFSVSHLRDAHVAPRGLRSFFEYRDLGIREATGGKVLAHVVRAKPGASGVTGAHFHRLDFQMFTSSAAGSNSITRARVACTPRQEAASISLPESNTTKSRTRRTSSSSRSRCRRNLKP